MVPVGYGALSFPHDNNERLVEGDEVSAALVNAKPPQVVPEVPEHRSNGARDRSVRTSRHRTVGTRPVSVRQGKSLSAQSCPATTVDDSGAAAATADHRQAEYFMRLLTQSRRRIDHRIDDYQKAIAVSEAGGDAQNASSLRRMKGIEEQDRRTVQDLIENLQRRFPFGPGLITAAPSSRVSGELPESPNHVICQLI
jgi:hypothetical protein